MSIPSVGHLIADERISLVRARVEAHEGEITHFETSDEGHVTLSVKTCLHGVPIHAVMFGGSDDSSGEWRIPALGTEVLIGFDDGDFEADAFIVQVFGNKPPVGLTEAKCFVIGEEVEIRSANGTAVKLATLADAQAIRGALDGHAHTYIPGSNPTVVTTGNPTVPAPVGTSVLRGE